MSPLLGSPFAGLERLGSKPRVLFTIAVGARIWRYAQAARDVTVAATSLTYKAAQIEVDGDVERREEVGPQRISVRLSNRLDVVDVLKETGSEPRFLGIHRYHPAAGGNPARWAYGAIVSFRRVRGAVIIELLTEEGAWDGIVPRAVFSPQCQKDTYTPECGIGAEDFSEVCNVTAYDGTTVTVDSVSGHPDTWFSQGILRIGNRFWHITSQVGTAIKIFGKIPPSVTLPAAALIYAGDDLTHETCRDKFHNLTNFLGFKWLPSQDPTLDLEHRGPDALVAVQDTPDPPAYSRPNQFLWYRGDLGVTVDLDDRVQAWADQSGNGRDATQTSPAARPGYSAPAVLFGPPIAPYTFLLLPDLSALASAEVFIALNLNEYPVSEQRTVCSIHASGRGGNGTHIFPDGHVEDGLGVDGGDPMYYRLPDIKNGGVHVLNWTITAARYTVRLDGVPLFTTLPTDHPYSIGFQVSGNALGGDVVGSLTLAGSINRFLIYDGELNGADRATTRGYMLTGTGSPV